MDRVIQKEIYWKDVPELESSDTSLEEDTGSSEITEEESIS